MEGERAGAILAGIGGGDGEGHPVVAWIEVERSELFAADHGTALVELLLGGFVMNGFGGSGNSRASKRVVGEELFPRIGCPGNRHRPDFVEHLEILAGQQRQLLARIGREVYAPRAE